MRPLLAIAVAALLAAGCTSTTLQGIGYAPTDTTILPAPQTAPDIEGTLTQITSGTGGGTLRVEANPQDTSGSPKASVKLGVDTTMIAADGKRAQFGAFQVGQRLKVWFEGPVAESYPVQATAKVVQILP